jgi:hypothetical protein
MKSNINQFVSGIRKVMDDVRIDHPQVLDDLADAYSDVLSERGAGQVGPGGMNWPENAPEYAQRKGNLPVGVGFTGEMLAPANLKITASFIGSRLYLYHGGSPAAQQHLTWFQKGGRILWGLDEDTRQRFRAVISKHIHESLRNKR